MPSPSDTTVYAGLIIHGPFDPNTISQQLGLDPTECRSKGDRVGSRLVERSSWRLWSDNKVHDDRIEPHLEWLLQLVEPRMENVRSVVAESDVEARISCYWTSPGRGGGPWIAPTMMGRLSGLGLPLVISFYATADAEIERHG